MMTYYQLHPWEQISVKFERKYTAFSTAKSLENVSLQDLGYCFQASMCGLITVPVNCQEQDSIDSLAPEWWGNNFAGVFFKHIMRTGLLSMICETGIRWEPRDPTYGVSTLVSVIAWCRQASGHYIGHCWPWSMSSYGVTRSKWVKMSRHKVMLCFSEGTFALKWLPKYTVSYWIFIHHFDNKRYRTFL